MPLQIRTKQEAEAEAQRRWGSTAAVFIIGGTKFVTDNPRSSYGEKWRHFKGYGASWDAAFTNAEHAKARQTTPIACEACKKDTYVLPNGDCPTCGRLLTFFPGVHTDPEQQIIRSRR